MNRQKKQKMNFLFFEHARVLFVVWKIKPFLNTENNKEFFFFYIFHFRKKNKMCVIIFSLCEEEKQKMKVTESSSVL